MSDDRKGFEKKYSEKGFWKKVRTYAKAAGKEVIEKALWLFYAAKQPGTPAWAKTVVYSALGYFIFPIDAIPDVTPFAGYADDVGVLVAAVAAVSMYINTDVKNAAKKKLSDWFGFENT